MTAFHEFYNKMSSRRQDKITLPIDILFTFKSYIILQNPSNTKTERWEFLCLTANQGVNLESEPGSSDPTSNVLPSFLTYSLFVQGLNAKVETVRQYWGKAQLYQLACALGTVT